MGQALMLCDSLARNGIGTVIATPHQLGRFENRTDAAAIRKATGQLNRRLAEEEIGLRVLPGAEVRLDERVGSLLHRDVILTLADAHRHVLLELPDDAFIDIEPLVVQLARQDISLIIAHPERNLPLFRHLRLLRRWLDRGVALQVTAASLLGHWGRMMKRGAWELLERGWVAVVASDAHDCGDRAPHMAEVSQVVAEELGNEAADLLCIENPLRVLRGEELVPALPVSRQEVW